MSADRSETCRATLLRAIQIETRNAGIYDSLAQLFHGYDESVRFLFHEMAAEERQHGEDLEHRYRERFGSMPSPVGEAKEVIEAPDLNDPEALIFDSMTSERALEVGLLAEETAREFYRGEVARTADSELHRLFSELAEFEETHVRLLNKKLAERRHGPGSSGR